MGGRTRIKSTLIVPAGGPIWLAAGSVHAPWTDKFSTDTCSDFIDGTRDAHPLTIEHSHNVTYRVYGRSNGNSGWNYNGWPRIWGPPSVPVSQPFPSDNTSLSYALSRMTPNRPYVDLPVFLTELKDLPKLVFRWGEILANQFGRSKRVGESLWDMTIATGHQNLEWQFSIKPFVDDMRRLLDFEGAVEKRIARLKKMQSRGSIGGGIDVWQDNVTRTDSNVFLTPLYMEGNRVNLTYETSRRVWVSSTMTPTIALPDNDADMERLARRLVFGRDISAATLWQLMPWSWLIDWFGNVGDLLEINRGTLPIQWSGSCIMKHTVHRMSSFKHIAGPGQFNVCDPLGRLNEIKTRAVWGSMLPLPEFNLPFLNGKQLSILASLVVTRKVPTS